ncbi:Uncharacterized protein BP5553_10689 [Venustampulla echinocandica]|uniref:amidase n=1 Tax=Venustampulla echinocandica TaxID=2656787 RepID=A0A370T8J2_9HELO|nr:Uncharacterized protein BP5553_10689 [Venustampulla echinocandica]RDL29709.1 Uncharacterized protein BP5553_10689 [Venustampulla echinocandica]
MTTPDWQAQAQICRDILDQSIQKQWLLPADRLPPPERTNVLGVPQESGTLTARELEITETDATGLVASMAAGTWTAEEVAVAFLKRATLGHQLLNFATEFMAEEALAQARALDDHFRSTGTLVGPLHGVPISAKEMVSFEGRIVHTSYVSRVSNVASQDALIVRVLRKAGAVFHVRTNLPQTCMHLDCDNNITGRTLNPHNIRLSPGGSSGGEAAAVGFRGAAIGIASDIGGSIRLPAAFCGSYGIRPTTLRTPWSGIALAGEGQEAIRCTLGPITNSLRDLDLFMKAVTDGKPWEEETALVPLPWHEEPRPSPGDFTVGVLWDDGIVHPHPPMQRAMRSAVEKLRAAGIRTVDWEPYKHQHGMRIINDLFYPDGAATQIAALEESGEPWLPLTKEAFTLARNMTIPETWAVNLEREAYRTEHRMLMKERGIDVILCPAYVGVAAEPHEARYSAYTAIWNILDMPGVVFPTGLRVDQELDAVEAGYQPRGAQDEAEYKSYSPEKFVDAPIALQLVGNRFCDEATVAAAKVLEDIICV